VDVLTSIGIHPDGIVGHSVGELGCAYADGTFTAEQTVLAAYWRGRCILESKLPPGAMAAVGKSTVDPVIIFIIIDWYFCHGGSPVGKHSPF
jgi:fatty acid synthase